MVTSLTYDGERVAYVRSSTDGQLGHPPRPDPRELRARRRSAGGDQQVFVGRPSPGSRSTSSPERRRPVRRRAPVSVPGRRPDPRANGANVHLVEPVRSTIARNRSTPATAGWPVGRPARADATVSEPVDLTDQARPAEPGRRPRPQPRGRTGSRPQPCTTLADLRIVGGRPRRHRRGPGPARPDRRRRGRGGRGDLEQAQAIDVAEGADAPETVEAEPETWPRAGRRTDRGQEPALGHEEPPGPLGPGIAGDQGPERRPVPALHQVGQLVHDDVVDHPRREVDQPVRQPDRAVGRGARTPAVTLVRRPSGSSVGPRQVVAVGPVGPPSLFQVDGLAATAGDGSNRFWKCSTNSRSSASVDRPGIRISSTASTRRASAVLRRRGLRMTRTGRVPAGPAAAMQIRVLSPAPELPVPPVRISARGSARGGRAPTRSPWPGAGAPPGHAGSGLRPSLTPSSRSRPMMTPPWQTTSVEAPANSSADPVDGAHDPGNEDLVGLPAVGPLLAVDPAGPPGVDLGPGSGRTTPRRSAPAGRRRSCTGPTPMCSAMMPAVSAARIWGDEMMARRPGRRSGPRAKACSRP